MSYSRRVKTEIMKRDWNAPCCITAACYGIACFARVFDKSGLEFHTENKTVAEWVRAVYQLAGIQGETYARESSRPSYVFRLANPFELEKTMALFGHTGDETALSIHADQFLCENCLPAFTAAAFLCAGTIVDPQKEYNLEIISPRYKMMTDFAALLAQRGFLPKLTKRKGVNVLYFRASGQIEDMLTFMGAARHSLEMMQMKVERDLRNAVNRATNCVTANIDKTVKASAETIKAVQKLQKSGQFMGLPEHLRDLALLRVEYPDLSLAELAEHMPHPLSRSRLSQQFKQIRDRAAALGEK